MRSRICKIFTYANGVSLKKEIRIVKNQFELKAKLWEATLQKMV
jgi:hypothetical protein